MTLSPSWTELAIRLAPNMLAASLIGFNRGARGQAAASAPRILVGLAASQDLRAKRDSKLMSLTAWIASLLDLTVYGRQEEWEDSPPGWPHRSKGKQNFRVAVRVALTDPLLPIVGIAIGTRRPSQSEWFAPPPGGQKLVAS
jgi:hypothetical protein